MIPKANVLAALVLSCGLLAMPAHAAVDVELTVQTPPPEMTGTAPDGSTIYIGTWQVYAQIEGNTASTAGLAGIQFSVVGHGGLQIVDYDEGDDTLGTSFDLPADSQGTLAVGFNTQVSTGTDGIGISGYQNTDSYEKGSGANAEFTSVLTGVGLSAGSLGYNYWAYPVLVADGYYSVPPQFGFVGLSVECLPSDVDLLPATLPTPTTTPVSIETFHPETVNGVPEPASLAVLAAGALACLRRRKPF